MSIRNNENTLEKCLNSIINQTFKDFEFLIIDDFSTDGSLKILKKFEKKDSRIKVFQNNINLGLTKSLNHLINKSKGEYIARQDGDDVSLQSRFKDQFYYLESGKYDFCVNRAKTIQSKIIIPRITYYLPQKSVRKFKNPFIHGTLMIRKKTLLDIGGYDESFYYAQDYKLFYDLLENDIKFKYLKKPLYRLNIVDNISSLHKVEQKYYASCVKSNKKP